jgi:hypothetical protein
MLGRGIEDVGLLNEEGKCACRILCTLGCAYSHLGLVCVYHTGVIGQPKASIPTTTVRRSFTGSMGHLETKGDD